MISFMFLMLREMSIKPITRHDAQELLPVDISQCVDLGVYTRNRCFRIIDSSKYGKAATFKMSRRESMQHGWDPETDTNPLMRMMYLSSRPSQVRYTNVARL